MTTIPTSRRAKLTERVAEEIRALMGRRRVTQAELARRLGRTPMWVSYRLNGHQPIDLNDLEDIAFALGVTANDLVPRTEHRPVPQAGGGENSPRYLPWRQLLGLRHGEPVTAAWLSRRGSAYLSRIDLPDVTLHRFRHFFGTCIQREYRDLRVTQELLGHVSPDTTAGYALVTDGQCRSAVCTLPTLRSSPKVAA